MYYLIVQKDDVYTFIFENRKQFKEFCNKWQTISEYDLMIIEVDPTRCKSHIIWSVENGWLDC